MQFARNSVFGVTADRGHLLWRYTKANNGTANCATPVVAGDFVFASSAYGTGGGLARISSSPEGQKAEQVYFEKKMANHHGGLVLVGDYLYGYGEGFLIGHELQDGKDRLARCGGKGSLLYADGMLYCLEEGHKMTAGRSHARGLQTPRRIQARRVRQAELGTPGGSRRPAVHSRSTSANRLRHSGEVGGRVTIFRCAGRPASCRGRVYPHRGFAGPAGASFGRISADGSVGLPRPPSVRSPVPPPVTFGGVPDSICLGPLGGSSGLMVGRPP